MRRDDLRRRAQRQARLGRGRQGHRLRHRQAQRAGQGPADPGARPGFDLEGDPGRESSPCCADGSQACATSRRRGDHAALRKEKGRPLGRDHINGIEGFRSSAGNRLRPCRGVPKKVLHPDPGKTCYRFNHRNEDLKPLILKLSKTTNLDKIDNNPVQAG